jgi:hypothetical protein
MLFFWKNSRRAIMEYREKVIDLGDKVKYGTVRVFSDSSLVGISVINILKKKVMVAVTISEARAIASALNDIAAYAESSTLKEMEALSSSCDQA